MLIDGTAILARLKETSEFSKTPAVRACLNILIHDIERGDYSPPAQEGLNELLERVKEKVQDDLYYRLELSKSREEFSYERTKTMISEAISHSFKLVWRELATRRDQFREGVLAYLDNIIEDARPRVRGTMGDQVAYYYLRDLKDEITSRLK